MTDQVHSPKYQRSILGALMLASAILTVISIAQMAQRSAIRKNTQGGSAIYRRISTNDSCETTYRQLQRHNLMANVCAELRKSQKMQSPAWNNFIVDDRRRYVYCKVGQVAYSSWKRTLLNLADGVADARQLSFDDARGDYTGTFLRLLSSYAPDEIDHRLKTYFKFMFVRHPFERLVSAYRNRVARETGHQSPKQEESQPTKSNFEDFVRFTLSKVQKDENVDVHWGLQHAICRPCDVSYDFIGHYETLYEDADCILSRIGHALPTVEAETNKETPSSSSSGQTNVMVDHRNKLEFPRLDPGTSRKGSAELVDKMMAAIKSADVDVLYELYELDFRLFDYRRKR